MRARSCGLVPDAHCAQPVNDSSDIDFIMITDEVARRTIPRDCQHSATIERYQVRPIKFERRAALLKSIARGRTWLVEIVSGSTTVQQIAARHYYNVHHVNINISMAFIAPSIVKATVEGRLPRGIGVAALCDAPAEWSLQFERLGLLPN
jgi:site-specific DNA recombinase